MSKQSTKTKTAEDYLNTKLIPTIHNGEYMLSGSNLLKHMEAYASQFKQPIQDKPLSCEAAFKEFMDKEAFRLPLSAQDWIKDFPLQWRLFEAGFNSNPTLPIQDNKFIKDLFYDFIHETFLAGKQAQINDDTTGKPNENYLKYLDKAITKERINRLLLSLNRPQDPLTAEEIRNKSFDIVNTYHPHLVETEIRDMIYELHELWYLNTKL